MMHKDNMCLHAVIILVHFKLGLDREYDPITLSYCIWHFLLKRTL